MSKRKTEGQGHYEILFILPNKFTEEESKKQVEDLRKNIEAKGGKITYEEFWGKKKLAYQIKEYKHGYYALYEFDYDKEKLADLERELKMSNDILRHQIVKKPFRTPEQIAEEKRREDEIAKKNLRKEEEEEEKKQEKRKEIVQESEKKEEEKEEKAKKEKKDEKKVDLADLDEKLDKILDSDNLI